MGQRCEFKDLDGSYLRMLFCSFFLKNIQPVGLMAENKLNDFFLLFSSFKTKSTARNRFNSRWWYDSSVPSGYILCHVIPSISKKDERKEDSGRR